MMRALWRALVLGGFSSVAAQPAVALAQDATQPPATAVTTVRPIAAAPSWSFEVTPYLWLSGVSGKFRPVAGGPTVSVNKSFGEIYDHLDAGAFLSAAARRGRFVLLGDFTYAQVSQRAQYGPLGANLDNTQISATLEAGYEAYKDTRWTVDLLAGARAWVIDTRVRLRAFDQPLLSLSSTTSWGDPLLAARVSAALGHGLSVTAYGDVGGFDVGSHFTWQAVGTLDYAIRRNLTVSAGYRHLAVDYREGGSRLDFSLSGPLLGISYSF